MKIVSAIKLHFKEISDFFQKISNLFKSENFEDNFTIVVHRALAHHGVKVTYTSVEQYLKTHPNYPSFKSICDFLEEINVQNYPLRYEESELVDLNYPFIAHLKESGGKVIFVFSVDKKHIVYADSLTGKKFMDISEFYKKWDGAVIVIEPAESSGETEYKEIRKIELINSFKLPAVLLTFCLVIIYGLIFREPFYYVLKGTGIIILLITHFAGLFFSLLLLRQELDLKTKFTDKLCHIATNADCDAVTKSKASRIFGSITWADAGVVYFTGGLLSIFLIPGTETLNILVLFSLAALPYPVFSILYQWFKLKKWCPFCLSVQFVIIIEAVFAFQILKINELYLVHAFHVFMIFFAVLIIILQMKFLFISEREKKHSEQELLKLKRDPEMFLFKLRKGERIEIPDNRNALIFGNKQSNVLVSVFLSFHCSACAKKFDSVLKLIENNRRIKVQLILSPSKDENTVMFMKTIYSLLISGNNQKIIEELTIWFKTEKSERNKLLNGYQFYENTDGFEEMIEYNSLLFSSGKVSAVPSVFINGYPLPKMYALDGLKYFNSELENMKPILNELVV